MLRFCVGFCLVLERKLLFLRWLGVEVISKSLRPDGVLKSLLAGRNCWTNVIRPVARVKNMFMFYHSAGFQIESLKFIKFIRMKKNSFTTKARKNENTKTKNI
jgi:hypothetical protein